MSVASRFAGPADRDYDRLMALAARDPQIAALLPDDEVTASIKEPGLSYQEVLARIFQGYAERPALGVRSYEIATDPRTGRKARHYLPAYTTISYAELGARIEAIAGAWQHDPRHRVVPGEYVAIIAFTGAEMTAIDLACAYTRAIAVPLQANLPAPDMTEILSDVAPAVLVASIDNLALAVDYALQQQTVRSLVVIDADEADDSEREAIEAARAGLAEQGDRVALATFDQLLAEGGKHCWTPPPRSPKGAAEICMIMYTSGSTGAPKGALIHEGMCLQFWVGLQRYLPTVMVAYAPLNHFMGRIQVCSPLAQGGTAYFSLKSDLSTLVEDIRLVRPTYLQFMPRFAELVYQRYLSEVQRRVLDGEDEAEADRQVRAEMSKTYLGDRVIIGNVGSSPTAPEVQQFLRECFDVTLIDGYGSTEAGAGGISFNGQVNRNIVIDYKLRDVPELGYYTTDKPYPRGELVVKTKNQIQGYFKRPDATASIFDEDGYVLTGDIVEQKGPEHIEWLDRRNNVIKLSQAEFVAIGPLESKYLANNPLVSQMYLYGSSYRAFLLAVVVPDVDFARSQLGHEPTDDDLRKLVLAQLQAIARQAGLKSFEVPRDVLIEREPFSLENGLLSSVRKPLRPNLKRRYGDKLEAVYLEMDRKQQEELAQLRTSNVSLSTLDRVAGALKANLGLASVQPDNPQSYRDLGGDSLGAVGLSALLEEMFGVTVPVGMVLNPAGSATRIADYIDRALAGGSETPTFESVHGGDSSVVRASDLTLDRFLDAETLSAAADAAPVHQETRTVLLTGSTGFLGRFLCLEWLEWLSQRGGKLICLVRATDAAGARARLDAAIGTLDAGLAERFRTFADGCLEVIAADLAAPLLGLNEEEFLRLAREVDQIVHPGALVNHVLSYQNLFEPNVVGTAELIRLALTERQKRFDYVSTIGVPHLSPEMAVADEDVDVREAVPGVALTDNYASGYAASKWAGEVLLREAHEEFGLPVNVFRPDMILGHSRFRGQINVPDMFTRLLLSIALTGLAPVSFYEAEADGTRPRAHYDGLPVDFVAAAMQQIGSRPHGDCKGYNVTNTHSDDGISLDTIVDWMISAGYPLNRIEDHADWHHRLGEKLRQLPDEQRQQSLLNIMHRYAKPMPAHPDPLKTANFEAAVVGLPVGPGVAQLSESLIHKYLDDMHSLKLVPAAMRMVA